MDDGTEELYLQKIEEFVQDDDLIVTTAFLCGKLNIAIKDAKRLMAKYLTDHRNVKPAELGVHYTVLGQLCTGDKLYVILVSEAKLTERLRVFKSGYSQEIYSIQKAVNSDINALNLLIPEPRESALLGSIVGQNCLEFRKFIRKSFTFEPPKRKLNTLNVEKTNIPVEKKPKIDESVVEKKTSPKNNRKIANRPVQNEEGIAGLFSKMAVNTKKADKKPPAEEKTKILQDKTKILQDKTKILQEKPKIHEEKLKIHEEKSKKFEEKPKNLEKSGERSKKNDQIAKQSESLGKLIDTDNESDEEHVITSLTQEKANNIKKKTLKSSKKVNKKRTRKQETPEKSPKRRKRVIEPQSDSEDDIFGKESDQEHRSSDETPLEPIFKPKPFDPSAPKNKQKKFVNKSYVDGDGYMVTRREWQAVSGSEDEEPVKEQKAPITKKIEDTKHTKKPIEDKKALPTAKGKGKNAKKATNQPSILSFFNKK